MDRLRQLIREIHRRSLWQVLLIYVGASWAVLQVVDTVAGALQLPDWVEPVALILLIVGLPIVLATAFVQEGVSDQPGRAPEGAEAAPGATRLFTWRNAFAGGVLAFALWGVVAASWVLFGGASGEATEPAAGSRPEQSVAVIPFVNTSGNPDNEYFSDGITDELLTALAGLPALRVPGRTSSFAFKGQNVTIQEIADTLDVAHVLEGSVRRSGQRVRVTAQLIEAETDTRQWSETFEREIDDIFAIQREIAEAIANQLRVELGQGEVLVPEPPGGLEAYDLYLRARNEYLGRGNAGDIAAAIDLYEQALAADPDYALARAGVAEAWATLPSYGIDPEQSFGNAETEARAALSLDSSLALPQLVLADLARGRRQWTLADSLYAVAIDGLPNYPEAHHEYGEYLGMVGRCEEATAAQRRALNLDPLNGIFTFYLAYALTCRGDVNEAIRETDRLASGPGQEIPGASPGGRFLIFAMIEAGRTENAVEVARRGGDAWRLAVAEGIRSGIDRVSDLDESIPNSAYGAWGAALLGDREAALQRVEACAQGPCGSSLTWIWMPAVQRLVGDDERFQAALRRMGLADSERAN